MSEETALPFNNDDSAVPGLLAAAVHERAVEALSPRPFNTTDEEDEELLKGFALERAIAAAGGVEQFEAFKQRLADGEQIVLSDGVEIDCADARLFNDARRVCAEFNWNVNKALIGPDGGLPSSEFDTRFFSDDPFYPLVARTLFVAPNISVLSVLEADGSINKASKKGYAAWQDRFFGLSVPTALKAALTADDADQRIGKAIKAAKEAATSRWAGQIGGHLRGPAVDEGDRPDRSCEHSVHPSGRARPAQSRAGKQVHRRALRRVRRPAALRGCESRDGHAAALLNLAELLLVVRQGLDCGRDEDVGSCCGNGCCRAAKGDGGQPERADA
jgi:hypothetical protein